MSNIQAIAQGTSAARQRLLQSHLESLSRNNSSATAARSEPVQEDGGRANAIMKARATAMSIPTTGIVSVRTGAQGAVDIRSNLEYRQECRLETALQCDLEFQQLHRQLCAGEQVQSSIQAYA